jgi:hypothetical protein
LGKLFVANGHFTCVYADAIVMSETSSSPPEADAVVDHLLHHDDDLASQA